MDLTLAICMYNAAPYIEQTLSCILKQTRRDFHLLIVDDCSTDDSIVRVESFFKTNPRQFELQRLDINQGIAHARQWTLTHATTKYLLFIDADDCPLPTLLEKEYAAIEQDANLIAVSSWLQFIDKNAHPIKGGLFMGAQTKDEFMRQAESAKRIFLPIQTLFDRECALRVGGFNLECFPEGKPRYRDFCEDLDLWTRMSDLYVEGKYMLVLPEVLYYYRKTDGLSSNHFNMIIKMTYTKVNLRRRRAGLKDLTFIEYYQSLTSQDIKKMRADAIAADNLRNAAFYLKEHLWFKGIGMLVKSVWYKPTYILDKLINNYRLLKKK